MMVKRRLPSANRPPPTQNRNLLLASLPADEYRRILPTLSVIPLKLKEILQEPGGRIDSVLFPGGGFCSVVTVLEDGTMVEVATIGREGAVGVLGVMDGAVPAPSAAMVQGETATCYRMNAVTYRREMDRRGPFYELMTRYQYALIGTIMQSTACNAIHKVEQRLARWLLLARDRMESNDFPLTQEFAAMMLAVARPPVSIVAGTLQKAGLITYRHGRVRILDGTRLEAASCECYRVSTTLLQGVMGGSQKAQPRA